MFYNRALSEDFAGLLVKGGELRWLFDFAANHEEMDLQIARSRSKQWIAIYYGDEMIISVKRLKESSIFVDTAAVYHKIAGELYGKMSPEELCADDIENFLEQVRLRSRSNHDHGIGKTAFPLNSFSRRYGILGNTVDDFAVTDREPAIGFRDQREQESVSGNIHRRYRYFGHQAALKIPDLCIGNPDIAAMTGHPDFLGSDSEGNVLVIILNNSSVKGALCCDLLRLGINYDLFSAVPKNELEYGVLEMVSQRQRIGLINPAWKSPSVIREVIPVLAFPGRDGKADVENDLDRLLEFIRREVHDDFLLNLKILP